MKAPSVRLAWPFWWRIGCQRQRTFISGMYFFCEFGVLETCEDQSSTLGDPKASWNHFRDTLGSGQGLPGALGGFLEAPKSVVEPSGEPET